MRALEVWLPVKTWLGLATGLLLACSPAAPGAAERAVPPASGASERAPAVAPEARPTAAPPPLIRTRSAYSTLAVNSSPSWLALEGGYFREQGLEVELQRISSGAPVLAAMSNGEVEVTQAGGATLVLGYLQSLNTKIIGSTSNVMDSVVFARPEIQSVEGLRGKVIAVSRLKSLSDVAGRMALQRLGLQPDVDVFFRGVGGQPEMLAAMETGAADGAVLGMPLIHEARQRGFYELLDITALRIPFAQGAIGATQRVLDERPELADRYLRAVAQALHRLQTDREFAIEVVGKYSQVDDRELLGATVDYFRPIVQLDLYPERAAVQTVIDLEEHPGARTLRPEDVTDYRFADQLQRSGFLETLRR
ncbi:MAG TPA: ABC transporter substrate-binding protein [Chloroflexota bacterium]|nr:ABC transporter substrate-binding protein [Chloroflexota bacterium]